LQGIGRRFAFAVCRKADVDVHKRAGELSEEDMEKLTNIMLNPTQYKVGSCLEKSKPASIINMNVLTLRSPTGS
jgi:ribosomal protein S13